MDRAGVGLSHGKNRRGGGREGESTEVGAGMGRWHGLVGKKIRREREREREKNDVGKERFRVE